MNEELSVPAKDCITRAEWEEARDRDPVHVVVSERVATLVAEQ